VTETLFKLHVGDSSNSCGEIPIFSQTAPQ